MSVLPLGPLMIDVAGTELTAAERERLCHPLVGGVILFARNYADPAQLARLTEAIRRLREPALLIGVDHEGGRVQRFREGFTCLPAMAELGKLWSHAPAAGVQLARQVGWVLAAELRAVGVDLSFTPVLDLDYGRSSVVAGRALHRSPAGVVALAGALIAGLRMVGMGACGKHFPGHGYVDSDSHVAIPVDSRSLAALQEDIAPYRELRLDAIMPAHVTYPEFDTKTSCFSNKWINYLRNDVKFDGALFSDDLSMQGASVAGDVVARVQAAWQAGCDMLLVCNDPEAADTVLSRWAMPADAVERRGRIEALRPTSAVPDRAALANNPDYRRAVAAVTACAEGGV